MRAIRATVVICLLAVAACLCAVLLAVRAAVVAMPAVADAAIAREGRLTRDLVDIRTGEALAIVRDTALRANVLLTATERDTDRTIRELRTVADRRTSDAIAIVKDAAALTVTEVQGLRADLKPALDSIAPAVGSAKALVEDAKDSWDANYYDVQAIIGSAAVATAGVGRAADAVAKAAPKLTDSAVGIGKSADGIAADVHHRDE